MKPEVIWHGPVYDPSGYAAACRDYIMALYEYGVKVRNQPVSFWSPIKTPAISGKTMQVLKELENTHVSPYAPRVWQTVPDCYRRLDDNRPEIGYTVFESDSIPPQWVNKMNKMNGIFVPCDFNVKTFARGGFNPNKMHIVPHVIDTVNFNPDVEPLNIPFEKDFLFFSMMDVTPRKGWDILLKAYMREFKGNKDVGLVFKGYFGGCDESHKKSLKKKLENFGQSLHIKNPPDIIFLGDIIDQKDIPRLYKACDCVVSSHRGEGWGMLMAQGMAMGMPVIGTNWSGNLEYMDKDNSYLIDVLRFNIIGQEMEYITPNYKGQKWAEPSEEHLRRLMREVYENRDKAKEKGIKARKDVKNKFSPKIVAKKIVEGLKKFS